MDELVQEVLSSSCEQLENVCVDTLVQPERVQADEALLRRVFENVVGNSLKYAKGSNDQPLVIKLSVYQENAWAVIDISDNGPGVAPTDKERIFDPFYRADAAREHPEEGSGMGLAFVRWALERMGGTVDAYEFEPHGLGLRIQLPCAKGE